MKNYSIIFQGINFFYRCGVFTLVAFKRKKAADMFSGFRFL